MDARRGLRSGSVSRRLTCRTACGPPAQCGAHQRQKFIASIKIVQALRAMNRKPVQSLGSWPKEKRSRCFRVRSILPLIFQMLFIVPRLENGLRSRPLMFLGALTISTDRGILTVLAFLLRGIRCALLQLRHRIYHHIIFMLLGDKMIPTQSVTFEHFLYLGKLNGR